jgi:hypothetical protein
LDAFVGSGTTLVEGLKRELSCTGVDANPVAVLAARVKTNWSISPTKLLALVPRVVRAYKRRVATNRFPLDDLAYRYIVDEGMMSRGWIRSANLRRSLALKQAINCVDTTSAYRDALRLALLSTVVQDLANVRFGPELYCGAERDRVDASLAWKERVETIAQDLLAVADYRNDVRVLNGDARRITSVMRAAGAGQADAAICSPPYPAEHDYTRNTRLELAFLESVTDRESLRVVKRQMLRSHTKNIYVGDSDRRWVEHLPAVQAIARAVAAQVRGKSHGFARYYESVILEYFGGMARHFRSLRGAVKRGAPCAFVVGEQASYASVHVPTAKLLSIVAADAGWDVEGIDTWRDRKSSTTAVPISESILFLRRPKSAR